MAREATLEEVAESGRLSRARILKIAVAACLLLFLLGAIGLSFLFSSSWFADRLDRVFKPALRARGITFEGLEVSPLGKITLTNLRIKLPDGQELFLPTLEGYANPTELLRGRAKATFDVSELARQYLDKSRRGLRISPDSKVLYVSVSADLLDPKDIRGTIYLEGVRLDVTPPPERGPPFPLHFKDGELSLIGDVLSAQDLDFRLPASDPETGQDDLILTFDGNIRRFFTTPEFVAGRVRTQVRTEPVWKRARTLLQLAEVSRKIRWYGGVEVIADLEGPIFAPEARGKVQGQDLLLRMRGDFREIDILFEGLAGDVGRGEASGWTVALTGGRVSGQYFRLRDSVEPVAPSAGDDAASVVAGKVRRLKARERLPRRLYLFAEGVKTQAVYRDRVLTLKDLVFVAYQGKALGQLRWDLNERNIQLGPGRYGDTAYEYRLGLADLDLGSLLRDVTALDRPFEGKITGLLEGKGRTLMLERMSGNGRLQVAGMATGNPPRLDLLREALGPRAAEQLAGIPLGELQAEWILQGGELQVPSFSTASAAARLSGSLRYHVLNVEIGGALRLTLVPGALGGREALVTALGATPMLEAGLAGTVDEPLIQYRARGGAAAPR